MYLINKKNEESINRKREKKGKEWGRTGKGKRGKEKRKGRMGVYKKGCQEGKYRNCVKMGKIIIVFTSFRTIIENIKISKKSRA
jgi:hypothetical protein